MPSAYFLHAPAPSQKPVCLQLLVGSVAHSLSGSLSTAMLPHTPLAPEPFFAALHAWHSPPHGASQQKPSTQLPLEHWVLAPHAAPLA